MPRSREVVPEGSPSELYDFLVAHPASTIDEAITGIKLERSTAYYALTRLHDLGFIKVSNRSRPHRWKIVEDTPAPMPEPTVPFLAAAAADPFTRLFARSTSRTLQPSGVPFTVVDGRPQLGFRGCELMVLAIGTGKTEERAQLRPGPRQISGTDHPWRAQLKR